MTQFSKTQIDRLGERLKVVQSADADLRMLAEYRDSFAEPSGFVVDTIRRELGLEPARRLAKSNASISAKLRRESIRLTQIQDIAGCRLVVSDIAAQDQLAESLTNIFEPASVIDRRERPSFGYRAVHLTVRVQGKLIEIQGRTKLQHMWAELSEKFFNTDPEVKYGGGTEFHRSVLSDLSSRIADYELREQEFMKQQSSLIQEKENLAQLIADLINPGIIPKTS